MEVMSTYENFVIPSNFGTPDETTKKEKKKFVCFFFCLSDNYI